MMQIVEKPAFGICHLSVVPVRTEPADKAEISTHLLFGEAFRIESFTDDSKWVKIITSFDYYPGWIDSKQFQTISKEYFEEYLSATHFYTHGLVSFVFDGENRTPLVLGSTIPFFNNGICDLGQGRLEFKGSLFHADHLKIYRKIQDVAMQYLGAPYLWGGKSPFGIDCSGFTQQVFKLNGIALLRDARQQAEQGMEVTINDAQPGDLAFFFNVQGKIIHVGILLENNKIIHASGQVRIDQVDSTGILHSEKKTYSHKLAFFKRIIPSSDHLKI